MAFIPNSGIDYDKAFEVSSITLVTANPDSSTNNTLSPSAYGLNINTPFVSGFY